MFVDMIVAMFVDVFLDIVPDMYIFNALFSYHLLSCSWTQKSLRV